MAKAQTTLRTRSGPSVTVMLFGAALCWASGEATAGAQTLAAPVFTTSVVGDGEANALASPYPLARISTLAKSGELSASAAVVTYQFAVTGPPGNLVPIDVLTTLAYSISGAVPVDTTYIVSLGVDFGGMIIDSALAEQINGMKTAGDFLNNADTVSLDVTSGVAYTVDVSAFASVNNVFVPHATTFITASTDPTISFAPGFDATGYTLELSPGVGNGAPGVPEPATWAMMLMGFGGLGAAMRSLRRQIATA